MLFSQTYFSLNTLPHTSVSLTRCIAIVFSVLNILTHMTTMGHFKSLGCGMILFCAIFQWFLLISYYSVIQRNCIVFKVLEWPNYKVCYHLWL